MAVYYAVYDVQSAGFTAPAEPNFEGSVLLTAPEDAKVIKLEAESVAAAQQAVEHFYGGDVSANAVIVTAAQWKES